MDRKTIGLILIVLGIAALVYGGFTYTKSERGMDLGFVEFNLKNKETVHLPPWVGVAGIVVGVLLYTRKR